jgi:zinc transporter ZupT
VMPGLGTFAMVGSAAIALLHLLPEAIAEVGWLALGAAAAGFLVPFGIERLVPSPKAHAHGHAHHGHAHTDGPALLVGYLAVLLHQAGEGTAVASLSRAGELKPTIVLAIAGHTVPLAMVVAIQALEHVEGPKKRVVAALALVGCALSTVGGALSLDLVGAARLATVRPWLVAAVAGLLLHALTHAPKVGEEGARSRVTEIVAGLVGLSLALVSLEHDGWVLYLGWPLRVLGVVVLVAAVVAKGLVSGARTVEEHPLRSDARDPRVG